MIHGKGASDNKIHASSGDNTTVQYLLPLPGGPCLTGRVKVDLGIWSKLTRVVIFLLLVAVVLGIAVWYLPLIKQNERYRKRVDELGAQVQKEEETSKQLKASIDAMRNDSKSVERLARKLGYAKPGETIIRFEDPATNTPAPPR